MVAQEEKQKVFVGLGNPGAKYEMTRHNMGAIAVQGFAHMHGVPLKQENRFSAKVAKARLAGATAHFVLPTTYMNESGVAVRKFIDYFKLTSEDVVVVSDDADLPFGEIRLRQQGSSGGHNGLKSVQKHLGTNQYTRLRIGIGRRNETAGELSGFVLDRFNKEEAEMLPLIIEKSGKAMKMLLDDTVENVMNVVNVRKKEKKSNTLNGDKQEEIQ